MTTPIFGAFIASWQLEQAVIAHLRAWMPDYLPYVYRQAKEILDKPALPAFPLPKSYTVVPREPDKWKEDQLPAILVVSPGLTDRPTQDGADNYRATFDLGIAAIVSTGSEETSKLFADLYFAAASMICLDKPSLGSFAEGTTMESAENDWLTGERNRTLASTFGNFNVAVAGFREITGGPPDHLEDPSTDPGDFETPLTTELELEKEEIPT